MLVCVYTSISKYVYLIDNFCVGISTCEYYQYFRYFSIQSRLELWPGFEREWDSCCDH